MLAVSALKPNSSVLRPFNPNTPFPGRRFESSKSCAENADSGGDHSDDRLSHVLIEILWAESMEA
jgi:hypothetical protein